MAVCSDAERNTLAEAQILLRFAAEHLSNLDDGLIGAIAEAEGAARDNQWTVQVSQRLWNSFSKLSDLIKPVTIDSLKATCPSINQRRWWRLERTKRISLAERSSRRYMCLFLSLLAIILPLQLYVWACTNLSKKIEGLIAVGHSKLGLISGDYIKLSAETKDMPIKKWSTELVSRAQRIQTEAKILAEVDARIIMNETELLKRAASLFFATTLPVGSGQAEVEHWWDEYVTASGRWNAALAEFQRVNSGANLMVGVLASFVLPILFGAMGAVAFIIRAISEQIRSSTFSSTSPVRHTMRVALGALIGVVVGLFSGLSAQLSLPPLALAFLGGYGVEAVFAMFDGIIERFRQTKSV